MAPPAGTDDGVQAQDGRTTRADQETLERWREALAGEVDAEAVYRALAAAEPDASRRAVTPPRGTHPSSRRTSGSTRS